MTQNLNYVDYHNAWAQRISKELRSSAFFRSKAFLMRHKDNTNFGLFPDFQFKNHSKTIRNPPQQLEMKRSKSVSKRPQGQRYINHPPNNAGPLSATPAERHTSPKLELAQMT